MFMWAVEGLAKLRTLRQFPRGPRGEEIEARHRADCDHERQFLIDRYEPCNGSFLDSQGVYLAYRVWCDENGYCKKNMANFTNELRRVFPGVLEERRRVEGRKVRGFLNLAPAMDPEGGL